MEKSKKEILDTQIVSDMLKNGYPVNLLIEQLNRPSLSSYLFDFICKTEKSVEVIAGLANLHKATLYRILGGEMNPKRNVLLRLSRVLNMDLPETQQLLKCGNAASLGAKPRDIIIMDGILHNKDLADINEELVKRNLPDIFSNR